MKINTVILSCGFILLSVLLGCKKEDDCFTAIGINGEWIWVESIGGFGGWTITPETEKLTRKLIIDDFIYKEYVNDSLVLETEYEMWISDDPIWGTEERTFIRFDSGGEKVIIIGDTDLEIIDQCIHCYSDRYKRN